MRHPAPSSLFGIGVLPLVLLLLVATTRAGPELAAPPEPGVAPEPRARAAAPEMDGYNDVAREAGLPAGAEVAPDPLASAEAALAALSPLVGRASHPDALRLAFQAYFSYRDAHPGRVRKPYFYFVDLGLDNRTPRGYVFDMESLTLVEGPFMVSHGRGSSPVRDGVPTTFSNRPGSYASSLGLYLAQETYTFSGKAGGRAYRSVGLRMRGESGPFNSAARPRGIVAHGAPYVTPAGAGRSEGCPAMEQRLAARLLPLLADGGVVLIYSPKDPRWLRDDPWIQAALAAEG